MWFTVTTMISGNSNIVPTTYYGEGISVLMMLIGISFVGILTASLASWLISRTENKKGNNHENRLEKMEGDLKDIKTNVNDLKKDLNDLKTLLLKK